MSAPFSTTPYPIKFSSRKRLSIQPKLGEETSFLGQSTLTSSRKRKSHPFGEIQHAKNKDSKSFIPPFHSTNLQKSNVLSPRLSGIKQGERRALGLYSQDDESKFLSEFNDMIEAMRERIRNTSNSQSVLKIWHSRLSMGASPRQETKEKRSLTPILNKNKPQEIDMRKSSPRADIPNSDSIQEIKAYIHESIQSLIPIPEDVESSENSEDDDISLKQRFEVTKSRVLSLWDWLEIEQDEKEAFKLSYFGNASTESIMTMNNYMEDVLAQSVHVLSILKRISEREEYISKLKEMIVRFEETRLDKNNFVLAEAATLLMQIRRSTRKSLEAIQKWLNCLKKPKPFKWKGVDYLIKIRNDAKELNQSILVSTLQDMSPEMKQKLFESTFGSLYDDSEMHSVKSLPKLHTEKRFHERYHFVQQKFHSPIHSSFTKNLHQPSNNIQKFPRGELLPAIKNSPGKRSHRQATSHESNYSDIPLESEMEGPYFQPKPAKANLESQSNIEGDEQSTPSVHSAKSTEQEEYWASKRDMEHRLGLKLKPLKLAHTESNEDNVPQTERSRPIVASKVLPSIPQTARAIPVSVPEDGNIFQRRNSLQPLPSNPGENRMSIFRDNQKTIIDRSHFSKTLSELVKEEDSALIIQCALRAFLSKKRFYELKLEFDADAAYITLVQSGIRCILQRIVSRNLVPRRTRSAITIQRVFRGFLSRRETNVLKIVWEMEKEEQLFEEKKAYNAILVQKRLRSIIAQLSMNEVKDMVRIVDDRIHSFFKNLPSLIIVRDIQKHTQTHILFLQSRIRSLQYYIPFISTMKHIVTIQSATRRFTAMADFLNPKRKSAALTIQCFWRSSVSKIIFKAKKYEKEYQVKLYKSTLIFQSNIRTAVCKANMIRMENLVVDTQSWMRRTYFQNIYLKELFLRQMHAKRHSNAIIIQQQVRIFLSRKKIRELRVLRKKESCALVLQQVSRSYLAQDTIKQVQAYITSRNNAANCIQRSYKCFKARLQLHYLREKEKLRLSNLRDKSALSIQLAYRQYLAWKVLKDLSLKQAKLNATYLLQRYSRMVLERDSYCHRLIIIRFQSCIRTCLQISFMQYLKSLPSYDSEESWCLLHPVTIIQRAWKARLRRDRLSIPLARFQIAKVTHIQSVLRGNFIKETCKLEKSVIILVQSQLRQYIQRTVDTISTITLIQLHLRSKLEQWSYQAKIQNITHVQSNIRTISIQRSYERLKEKVIIAWTQMMIGGVSLVDYCALTIQQAWRIYVARSISLKLRRNRAALKIQCMWRRYQSRKKYNLLASEYEKRLNQSIIDEHFAIQIQKVARGHLARKLAHQTRQHDKEAYIRSLYSMSFEKVTDKIEAVEKKYENTLSSLRIESQEKERVAIQEIEQLRKQICDTEEKMRHENNMQITKLHESHLDVVQNLNNSIKSLRCQLEESEEKLVAQNEIAKRTEAFFMDQIYRLKNSLLLLQNVNSEKADNNQFINTKIRRTLMQDTFLMETCGGDVLQLKKFKHSVQTIENIYIAYCQRKRDCASITIQLAWRQYKSYLIFKKLKNKATYHDHQATKIQKVYRGYLDRKELNRLNEASFIITHFLRHVVQRKQSSKFTSSFKN